jgi:AraC family chitin signaling transcriptional activator
MTRYYLLIGVYLTTLGVLVAQQFPEKGVPLRYNYSPEQYEQAGKIWSIAAAENGLTYYASEQGLLEFDGAVWQLFRGSKGFTRSVFVESDSVIYTGSDKDFGKWVRNALHQFEYESLYPFRESTKGLNEEFWGVYEIEGDMVFTSFNNIYVRKAGQLTKVAAPSRFSRSFFTDGKLYLTDEKYGLYHFDGLTLRALMSYPVGEPLQIVSVVATNGGLLLVTRKQGLYHLQNGKLTRWNNEVNPFLQQYQVFSFTAIDNSHYAFGTILDGVYITNAAGEIIQHLNKRKGLPNNTILSLYYSPVGTLWLSMDYGLTALHLSSEVAYVLDHEGSFGTGQVAMRDHNTFYLGTNQGLYRTDWDALRNDVDGISFSLVPGSAGQVWTLAKIAGQNWCGHDRGLLQFSDNQLIPVYSDEGVLAIEPLGSDYLLTGTYNGVSLLQREDNSWTFVRKLEPLQGACSQLATVADNQLWVNIPNFGLIRTTLDTSYTIVQQKIFPIEDFLGEYPYLERDTASIHVYTTLRHYTYEPSTEAFTSTPLSPPYFRIANQIPQAHRAISLGDGFQFYPVFNGFALQRSTSASPTGTLPPLTIRHLTAFNNDTVLRIANHAELPFQLNNIRVRYGIPQQPHVQYRYRLSPKTDQWSPWSAQTERSFLQLPENQYTLSIEAKAANQLLSTTTIAFSIAPPWYRRWYAYALYLLLLTGLFYSQRRRHKRKLAHQRTKLQERERIALNLQAEEFQQAKLVQRQQTMEAEITTLQKQLRSKTVELAKKARESENKSRLLETLRNKLTQIKTAPSESHLRWSEMKRLMEDNLTMEDRTFELQMDELNQDFLQQLKANHPELTTYDLRLSTYLKSGLSSREIAEIMNVLPSSVNVSRSRLRKKLGLNSEDSLYDFLNQIKR